jgi:hypothetical protein
MNFFFIFILFLSESNLCQDLNLPKNTRFCDFQSIHIVDSIPNDTIPFRDYIDKKYPEEDSIRYVYVCMKSGYNIQHLIGGAEYTTAMIYPDNSTFYFARSANLNSVNISKLGDSIMDLFSQHRFYYIMLNEYNTTKLPLRPDNFELSGVTNISCYMIDSLTKVNDSLYWRAIKIDDNGLSYGYLNVPKERKAEFDYYFEHVFYTPNLIKKNYNCIDTIYEEECQVLEIEEVFYSYYYIYVKPVNKDEKYVIVSPIMPNIIDYEKDKKIEIGKTYKFKLTFHDKKDLRQFSPISYINIKGFDIKLRRALGLSDKIALQKYNGSDFDYYIGRPASASNLNGLYYISDE